MSKSWLEMLRKSSKPAEFNLTTEKREARQSTSLETSPNNKSFNRYFFGKFQVGMLAILLLIGGYFATTLQSSNSKTSGKEDVPDCDVEKSVCRGLENYQGLTCTPESYWLVNNDKGIILQPQLTGKQVLFVKYKLKYSPTTLSWGSAYVLNRSTLALKYKRVSSPFGCAPDSDICSLSFTTFREGGKCELIPALQAITPYFQYVSPTNLENKL